MPKEYISPPEIGPTFGLYNKAIRVGNTLYVSGQVPWNRAGEVVGRGDIEAQSSRVFDNLRVLLEAGGASFGDVLETTTYTTNVLHRSAINEARQRAGLLGMANTIIVVQSLVRPEILVEVEAKAVVGEPRQVINPPDLWSAQGLVSHATRAGNTIYVSGQVAWDMEMNAVGPGNIEKQVEVACQSIRRVLEAAGASVDDVVRTTTFLTDIRYRPVVNEARKRFGLSRTANTTVAIPSLALSDLLVEVKSIAVVDTPKQVFNPPELNDTRGIYSQVIRAGNTVYVSGQVAYDREWNVLGRGSIEKQADLVFENIRIALAVAGASLGDVVNTTTYLTNILFRPAVNEARKRFGLTNATNTTLVISGLCDPDLFLEVEAIAVVDE